MIYTEQNLAKVKHHYHSDDGVSDHVMLPVFKPDSSDWKVVEMNLNEDGDTVEYELYAQTDGDSDNGIFQNRTKRHLEASQLKQRQITLTQYDYIVLKKHILNFKVCVEPSLMGTVVRQQLQSSATAGSVATLDKTCPHLLSEALCNFLDSITKAVKYGKSNVQP